jgi:hypothetical protein
LKDSIDDIEDEEERNKWCRVRHGAGIQLFGKNDAGVTCKYAGEWERDQRTGDGHQIYKDGSVYKGNFNNGVFNGQGWFWWPASKTKSGEDKHCYKGMWVDGKMHGKGDFVNGDSGDSYVGFFANN